jgi:DNA-binding NtrC family response regulator
MGKKILVVDDEKAILYALEIILEDMGHEVSTCQDSAEGIKLASNETYDLIITDLRMPGKNGAEVVKEVRAVNPEARILVITAFPGDPLASEALAAGAKGLLKKPFEIAKILDFLGDGQ